MSDMVIKPLAFKHSFFFSFGGGGEGEGLFQCIAISAENSISLTIISPVTKNCSFLLSQGIWPSRVAMIC